MLKTYKTASLIMAASILAGCVTAQVPTPEATSTARVQEEAPMLTIITSADPETQLMALVLTRAALQQGESPRILLCSAGGDLALQSPPEAALAPLAPRGASPAGLLRSLVAEGVRVEVCAIYLPNRPLGEEALLEGVGVATPADIAGAFTAPGTTTLSF